MCTLLKFPAEIHADLGHYVYRLVDPRDGMTFYVGKGQKDRVFDHMRGVVSADVDESGLENEMPQIDDVSEKVSVIRDILSEGLKPIHVIHRHGLSREEAFLAEAVLIDATPGLCNEKGGRYSTSFGPSNASQLVSRYRADKAEIPHELKVLAININRSLASEERSSIYEAVRGFWRIDVVRASEADVILAVRQGICVGVFQADQWLPADPAHFLSLEEAIPGRSGFIGTKATGDYGSIFLNKKLPDELEWKKGMATPFQYNYD